MSQHRARAWASRSAWHGQLQPAAQVRDLPSAKPSFLRTAAAGRAPSPFKSVTWGGSRSAVRHGKSGSARRGPSAHPHSGLCSSVPLGHTGANRRQTQLRGPCSRLSPQRLDLQRGEPSASPTPAPRPGRHHPAARPHTAAGNLPGSPHCLSEALGAQGRFPAPCQSVSGTLGETEAANGERIFVINSLSL